MGSSHVCWVLPLVTWLGLAACVERSEPTDAGLPSRPDAGKPDAGVAPRPGTALAVDGGFCCAPSAAPGCCMSYGGFVRDAHACGETCDGMPVPSPEWMRRRDKRGCEYWVEPDVWTDCCGCAPQDADAGAERCDPLGHWLITWDIDYLRCGPGPQLELEIAQDAGAAEPSVRFPGYGPKPSSCGGPPEQSSYEVTIQRLEGGCRFAVGFNSRWCANGEPQCEAQQVELRIGIDHAEVSGKHRRCWCTASPLEPEMWTNVTGRATRMR